MNKKYLLILLATGLIYRLIPHVANFSPLGAIALFSGFIYPRKYSWIIPISIMVVTDFFLGFHSTTLYVYSSFVLISFLGNITKGTNRWDEVLYYSVISSLIFFLITNFGVWRETSMYPKTLVGLLDSYIMAIPFFRNTLMSDLVFSGLFFGSYYYVLGKSTSLVRHTRIPYN